MIRCSREKILMYTQKRELYIESPLYKYRGFSVYSTNKTGVRTKMFITRANAASVIEQLLSTFSIPSQAPSLGWNCFMTMGSACVIETQSKLARCLLYVLHVHFNENPIYVFLFWELRGLSPNFRIHVSVHNLYIPRMRPHIFLQQNRQTDPGNILISHRYIYECRNRTL